MLGVCLYMDIFILDISRKAQFLTSNFGSALRDLNRDFTGSKIPASAKGRRGLFLFIIL